MRRTEIVPIYMTSCSALLIALAFVIGQESIFSAVLISLLLSLPLVIICFFINLLKFKGNTKNNSLMFCITYGSFIVCFVFHVSFNLLMLVDVIQKASLGPAQGYWLLILLFGSLKAIAFGSLLGAISYLWFKQKHH